jgi:hypothetical protein
VFLAILCTSLALMSIIYSHKSNTEDKTCSNVHHTALFPPLALQPNSGLGRLHETTVSLQLLDLEQSVGLLGRVNSSSQGLYLYTKTKKNAHTTQTLNIHALSGIRTHGPGVCASEDSLCLRPLGYRDRHHNAYGSEIFSLYFIKYPPYKMV